MFKKSEIHWSTPEKEAWPIIIAADKLYYLLDRKVGFNIYTDHHNLLQLLSDSYIKSDYKKSTISKLTRWRIKLMGLKYKIYYIQGLYNFMADPLSLCACLTVSVTWMGSSIIMPEFSIV